MISKNGHQPSKQPIDKPTNQPPTHQYFSVIHTSINLIEISKVNAGD
jgi:hypothetical protein